MRKLIWIWAAKIELAVGSLYVFKDVCMYLSFKQIAIDYAIWEHPVVCVVVLNIFQFHLHFSCIHILNTRYTYVYEGIDICLRDIAVYYSTIYLKYLENRS